MESRDKILELIKQNQPEAKSLPAVTINSVISFEDNYQQFKTVLESIGGKVELVDSIDAVKDIFLAETSSGKMVISTIPTFGEIDQKLSSYTAPQLEVLERAYLQATLGVAENGSVWLYESQMVNRLLPFICQHLVLVINKNDIVPTMHHAYQKIDVARDGFGVFLAGPSKTADIEQSLVIGAHGARTTTIFIVGS